jgi:hypothetical protein
MNNALKSIGKYRETAQHFTPSTIAKSIALTGFLAAAVFTVNPAGAVSLVNGDFETGDLTGWTTFTTTNGTNGFGFPNVTSFDTTGSGTSNSAQFSVGYVALGPGGGGGIIQDITLASGILNLSVDVAAFYAGGNPVVSDTGIFSLLLNGSVLDTFDAGFLATNAVRRDTLTASTNVTAGTYTIGIQITRPFFPINNLFQYVDNFVISGSSTSATAVPEPFTVIGSILGGTAAFSMRRKLKSSTKV